MSKVSQSILPLMLLLHMSLLVCSGQIIENGYYLSQDNRNDILYANNDTVILKYPSICGNYIFKGIVNKENELKALLLNSDCSYFTYIDSKEAPQTKVIFSTFDGESREKIISEALKCKIQGFDKNNREVFNKELNYEIIDSNYVVVVQDTLFSHAVITISIEGCFLDKVNFNLFKNEIIIGEIYFFPYLKTSPIHKIKFKKEKESIILFYPNEITYPDVKCLFCNKKRIFFERTDTDINLPQCILNAERIK